MSKKQSIKKKVNYEAPNLFAERMEEFKTMFPEVLTEGKIDFDKLKAALGEETDGKPERYSFTWAGKKDAIRLLQVPSRATLVPDKDESVNFDTTQNIFIEGDNLEILKLLWKPYFGSVKMIYIDPPYNTGSDLIYQDSYIDPLNTYLMLTGQKDTTGDLLFSNPETSGRYHSAWISMMYPRLFLARQILREDGVILVTSDDNEIHNLRMLLNEVFGEENFIDCIVWKKRYGGGAKEKYLVTLHEYVLFYAKDKTFLDNIFVPLDQEAIDRYYKYKDEKYETRGPYRTHPLEATRSVGARKHLIYAIPSPDGSEIWPRRQWWWEKSRAMEALRKNELEFIIGKDGKYTVHTKQYLRDEHGRTRQTKAFSIIDNIYTEHGTREIEELFGDSRVFSFPKPTGLIKRLIQIAGTSENDIVLDFFAGSCTLAQAALELNQHNDSNMRFIVCQLPEPTTEDSFAYQEGYSTIADIGKERIRRVIAKMKKDGEGKMDLDNPETPEDLGFKVFKLAESNYRPWVGVEEKDPEEYARQMELYLDPLLEGWEEKNVIYEVALKEGYSLSSRIEKVKEGNGNAIWKVTDDDKEQSFHICLDEKIDEEAAKALELNTDDLFICRGIALTDEMAANLALQCNLKVI